MKGISIKNNVAILDSKILLPRGKGIVKRREDLEFVYCLVIKMF